MANPRCTGGEYAIFDGDVTKFVNWRDKLVDHIGSKNAEWRVLLKQAQHCETDHVWQDLVSWHRGQYTGWQLSNLLYTFVVGYLGELLYPRRIQLAGNAGGNGFQLWKQLHADYEGGDDIVQDAGRGAIQKFNYPSKAP